MNYGKSTRPHKFKPRNHAGFGGQVVCTLKDMAIIVAVILLFTWEGVLELKDRVINANRRNKVGKGVSKLAVLIAAVSVLALGMCADANAKGRDFPEAYYQKQWCESHGGYTPKKALSDGSFPDCITKTHAVEVDFGKKAHEAIGQSINYAMRTGLKPGILLIIERDADWRALRRILEISAHYQCLGLDVWTVEAREEGK